MTRKFRMRPLAVGVLLATGSVSFQAIGGESGLYIVPNAGYYIFDHDNNNRVDDAYYYGIDIGFQINRNFAIQVGYSWLDDPEINTDYVGDGIYNQVTGGWEYPGPSLTDVGGLPRRTGDTVDAQLYRVEGVLNLSTDGPVVPYVALGYAHLEQDPRFLSRDGSEDKDDMISGGFGVKYMVTPNIMVGGDVRALHGWDNDDTDYTAGLNVGYTFAAAEPAPIVEEPKDVQPGDDDGDGVINENDSCPGTPSGVEVDTSGCPLDADGDGVPDYLDKCPGTPSGARVDSDGCPEQLKETITRRLDIKFDTAKAFVQPQYYPQIEAVAQVLREYVQTSVTIEGHTDNVGKTDYNQKLSQQRADSVREVLISQFSVDPSRVVAIGYGETRPVASNDTPMGKAENRRVEAVVTATVEKLQTPSQ